VQVRGLPALLVAVAFVVGGCASSHAADAPSRVEQAAQLRVLERPAVRSIKLTFIALTVDRDVRAAAQLERAADRSEAILSWVDDHHSFARANEASVECFDESLRELHERAEEFVPALRAHTLGADERRELRQALAESANCIQASD
jgi:hypothetical protein